MSLFLRHKTLVATFIAMICGIFVDPASGQSATDSIPDNTTLPRPKIELAAGVMSYFGDVGNLDGISQTPELNWGYKLTVRNPLSNSFDLDLFALFGTLSANERLIGDEANFRTSIRMGGLVVRYNFNALLPADRQITPYISAGISTFEFNPKGDRFDANGVAYNYWNDGSIRNLPQDAPNAGEAIVLQRDRDYESDLRLTNEEGINSYSLRTLSIPLGAGVDIKASPSFSVRLGAEYHLSFSDNLDNIGGSDVGRSGNDHFLFSNVGVVYNLQYKKKNQKKEFGLDQDLLASEYDDQDDDGVADIIDKCPNTPSDVLTDEYGCPLDGDKDGVADYLDLEPNTPSGMQVNKDGEGMSDADFEEMYALYMDSLGIQNFSKSQTFTADVERNEVKLGNRTKGYRVVMDTESGGVESGDIAKMLSIADIKSDEVNGKTTYYLGEFQDLQTTVSKKLWMDEMGVSSHIVYNEFGNYTEINPSEVNAIAQFVDAGEIDTDGTVFRVQIGAYRYKLSREAFNDVNGLLIIEGDDGLTRYVSGSFPNIKDAAEHKVDLLLKGFEGAFVTAYRDGKRITLKEAGARVSSEEDITTKTSSGGINKEFVKFTVQVGSFTGRVPAETLGKFMELGNIRPIRSDSEGTKYIYGTYNTFEEAAAAQKEVESKGFKSTSVVGEFNGKIISADEARRIITE